MAVYETKTSKSDKVSTTEKSSHQQHSKHNFFQHVSSNYKRLKNTHDKVKEPNKEKLETGVKS